jgi:hypothetical protein
MLSSVGSTKYTAGASAGGEKKKRIKGVQRESGGGAGRSPRVCDMARGEPRRVCDMARGEPRRVHDTARGEPRSVCDMARGEPRRVCDTWDGVAFFGQEVVEADAKLAQLDDREDGRHDVAAMLVVYQNLCEVTVCVPLCVSGK